MRPFELGTGNVLKILQSNENTPCKTLNARVVDYQGRQLSFTRGEVVLVSQTIYLNSFIFENIFYEQIFTNEFERENRGQGLKKRYHFGVKEEIQPQALVANCWLGTKTHSWSRSLKNLYLARNTQNFLPTSGSRLNW